MVAGILVNGCWVVSQWLLVVNSMVAGLLINGCWVVTSLVAGLLCQVVAWLLV